jgi:hypothetical protein
MISGRRAEMLGRLLKSKLVHVNLIPLNPRLGRSGRLLGQSLKMSSSGPLNGMGSRSLFAIPVGVRLMALAASLQRGTA